MPDTNYGIPYPGPMPVPTPEHQRKITREKWFEIITVISLIVAGASFLAWRNYASTPPDPSRSLADSLQAIATAGYLPATNETFFGQQFRGFSKDIEGFTCQADLVAPAEAAPTDAVLISLVPAAGATPSPEALQFAVNAVASLAQTLVPSSGEALITASKTMEEALEVPRPFEKGVGATKDGWKLTYITYRSYDETGVPPPMLHLVLHRLTAASDVAQADLNRRLYEALNQGRFVRDALRTGDGGGSPN